MTDEELNLVKSRYRAAEIRSKDINGWFYTKKYRMHICEFPSINLIAFDIRGHYLMYL